jgi:hypothetical protein
MAFRATPLDRLLQKPTNDWLVAGGLVTAHAIVVYRVSARTDVLNWFGPDRRIVLYQAAAEVVGIIVGLVITALVFYYAADHSNATRFVNTAVGDDLRRAWIGAITGPMIAVLALLAGIVVDGPTNKGGFPHIRWAIELLTLVVALRFGRLTWLFSRLLVLMTQEETAARRTRPVDGPRPKQRAS